MNTEVGGSLFDRVTNARYYSWSGIGVQRSKLKNIVMARCYCDRAILAFRQVWKKSLERHHCYSVVSGWRLSLAFDSSTISSTIRARFLFESDLET